MLSFDANLLHIVLGYNADKPSIVVVIRDMLGPKLKSEVGELWWLRTHSTRGRKRRHVDRIHIPFPIFNRELKAEDKE